MTPPAGTLFPVPEKQCVRCSVVVFQFVRQYGVVNLVPFIKQR